MKRCTVYIPSSLQPFLRHLHPEIKAKIRRALKELEGDPYLGKPLKEQLAGLYSYRVSQYRIVYQIDRKRIFIEIVEINERKIIYEELLQRIGKITP